MTSAAAILEELRSAGSPENVAGMARFGIVTKEAYGVPAPKLKEIARRAKKLTPDRHALARELWETGVHDARAVAYLIDDPKLLTAEQMEAWVRDFDNWAITDSTCGHLFSRSPLGYAKAFEWSGREEEFIKRAGIVMMAWLTVHDKKADDEKIAEFLPVLESLSDDERHFVKKAVNWSLRQIGKRSPFLNRLAIDAAERIKRRGTKAAIWIASGGHREV